MSMAAMVADMRTRFLVSLIFTVPIVLWSGVGSGLIGSKLATRLGIDRNWWLLLLSLPVILYSSPNLLQGGLGRAAGADSGHDGDAGGGGGGRVRLLRGGHVRALRRDLLRRGCDVGDVAAARTQA